MNTVDGGRRDVRPPIDAKTVRSWLAKELKRKRIDDELWQYSVDGGYVDDVIRAPDNAFAPLVEEAKRWLASRRQRTEQEIAVRLTEDVRERAAVVSEYLAKLAGAVPRVRRFRQEILQERLLAPDEARALLSSPLARSWPRDIFDTHGIPIVGHTVQIMFERRTVVEPRAAYKRIVNRKTGRVRFVHRVKDKKLVKKVPKRFVVHYRGHDGKTRSVPLDPQEVYAARVPQADPREQPPFGIVHLEYPGQDGQLELATARWKSILWELREISLFLARSYGWEERQANWFVLTGRVPEGSPLRLRRTVFPAPPARTAIAMAIEPWMPAKFVLQEYRAFQKQLLHRENRPIQRRAVALFRFVTRQMDDRGNLPPWKKVSKLWNEARQGWRYPSAWQIKRDYKRAKRLLMPPL